MTSRFTAGGGRGGGKKAAKEQKREETARREKDTMQKREASCPCPRFFTLKNRPAAVLSRKGTGHRKAMGFSQGE